MITHRNLTDYVYGLFSKIDIASCKSFGLMSTLSADLGNTVLYGALLSGGTLHLFTKDTLRNVPLMQDYFKKESIDCIKIVPSYWKALEMDHKPLLPKKLIVFGGEELSVKMVEKIKSVNENLKIVNHYGPTETTIGKLLHEVDHQTKYTTIPIGQPFSDTEAYIVDKDLNLCPVGVAGEVLSLIHI